LTELTELAELAELTELAALTELKTRPAGVLFVTLVATGAVRRDGWRSHGVVSPTA
jgi:DNA-binding IclR family transcriptional regulator